MAGPIAVSNRFSVTAGSETFDLDNKGTAFSGGTAVGTWKTNGENKIVISRASVPTVIVNAQWKFNANNELVLALGGTDTFNFQQDPALNPMYDTRNAVLRFQPDILQAFTIELHGGWKLTETHDMEFTPKNSAASTIKGFINNPESKFIFFFADTNRPLRKYKLGFSGGWQTALDDQKRPIEGQLAFNYKTEGGDDATFVLPKKITVSKTTNQLRYEYQKGGVQSIDFVGTLVVNSDFTVSYHFSRRFANSGEVLVNETTISFGAVLQKENLTGTLDLTLKKADGSTGTTTLSIAGQFAGVIGSTHLLAGFKFDQVRDGQKVSTTFGFVGELQLKQGTVTWQFATSNVAKRTIDLKIGTDIKLGPANVNSVFNLKTENGQVQGVSLLLGVAF